MYLVGIGSSVISASKVWYHMVRYLSYDIVWLVKNKRTSFLAKSQNHSIMPGDHPSGAGKTGFMMHLGPVP